MQGLFHLDKNWSMYKSIENIYPAAEITELENKFNHVIRRYGGAEKSLVNTTFPPHIASNAEIQKVS